MYALSSFIFIAQTAPIPDIPNSATGSQTPAIVGIVIALASAVGWGYSIFRTHRGDRISEEARHEAAEQAGKSAAIEANRQSFAQVMEALARSDREREADRTRFEAERARLEGRIEDLEGERDAQKGRIKELEDDVTEMKAHVERCDMENARLREQVRAQGMG